MEKNSFLIVLGGGLLTFLLYKVDAIGGFGAVVCAIIVFVASAIVAGNAKTKKAVERGQLLNQKLEVIPNFNVTRKINGWNYKYIVAIDEPGERVAVVGDTLREFAFDDLLACEIIEDGQVISQKSTTRTLGGALVGGIVAGGAGAIIGGLSGKTTEGKEISSVTLKFTLRDISNPTLTILAFDASEISSGTKKKIKPSDSVYGPVYKAIKAEVDNIKDVFSIIIDRVDQKYRSNNNVNNIALSLSDELLKLNQLKESGIITQSEFEMQKTKLLQS